ncbi:MAG: bifunctional tetrahydrofolate synthase/dihydrofolate synthase [Gammaproteobacteria bacterium]|nr:MAG: bifunctional tetrahydrofolate synthase/dihydrofolate synthase [Gammaproteobacteria bacterium]
MTGRNLQQWLTHLEQLHPKEMDLGLDRVRAVWKRLGSPRPAQRVITVAGTNGKGSVVAALQAVLAGHGLRVGVTTSPHLHRFNERIVITGAEASDGDIVAAFERIDAARQDISLTYFEFAILAAIDLMARAALDVAVLEVGLGGRLDAVNVIDADVAVISSVDLDHEAWLGDDRESIGYEKAGILRSGRPVVIGETAPPRSVLKRAAELEAPVYQFGRDFRWLDAQQGGRFEGRSYAAVCIEGLPAAALLPSNLAAALQAASLLPLELDPGRVHDALDGLHLPGRMQTLGHGGLEWMLDVAHNPHAAAELVARLDADARWVAVFGTFRDKQVGRMVELLAPRVEKLFLAPTPGGRGQTAEELEQRLAAVVPSLPRSSFAAAGDAMAAASEYARTHDCRVLVAGSFTLVASAATWLNADRGGLEAG